MKIEQPKNTSTVRLDTLKAGDVFMVDESYQMLTDEEPKVAGCLVSVCLEDGTMEERYLNDEVIPCPFAKLLPNG